MNLENEKKNLQHFDSQFKFSYFKMKIWKFDYGKADDK